MSFKARWRIANIFGRAACKALVANLKLFGVIFLILVLPTPFWKKLCRRLLVVSERGHSRAS